MSDRIHDTVNYTPSLDDLATAKAVNGWALREARNADAARPPESVGTIEDTLDGIMTWRDVVWCLARSCEGIDYAWDRYCKREQARMEREK